MLSAEEGGRAVPLTATCRPNHNFLGRDNRDMGMGAIDIPAGEPLAPGESRIVEMTLYPWPEDTDLAPGREWRIQEGGKLTAFGTVIELLAGQSE
jgi:translation elongation factor EF-Tu-like GTPase